MSGCCPHGDHQRLTERSWRTDQLVRVLDPTGSFIWRVISVRARHTVVTVCCDAGADTPSHHDGDCKSKIGASVIHNYLLFFAKQSMLVPRSLTCPSQTPGHSTECLVGALHF